MSDHTTPMVLAQVFRLLASDPSPQHKRWARAIWKGEMTTCDFHPCDMREDKALVKLGLAKKQPPHPSYPEDGPYVEYKGYDY